MEEIRVRRDYFLCVFLACVCASLFFVCFVPNYFTYNEIVVREFGLFERIMSAIYAVSVLFIIPVFAAYKKKIWITIGLASYGFLALLPEWILPRLQDKVAGDDAGIVAVVVNFIFKFIYGMVKAPFAALSDAFGDSRACSMSKWILPSAVILYIACQLYRFYRDAYVAEQLDPASIMDSTAKENNRNENADKERRSREPEVLGTVISAPVQTSANPNPSPEPKAEPAGSVKEDVIRMGAPKTKEAAAIPMPPPKSNPAAIPVNASPTPPPQAPRAQDKRKPIERPAAQPDVIQMGAPGQPYDDNGAIRL